MKSYKIREFREKQGYTQTKLAEILGIDRSYLNSIENGRFKPSIALLERIAEQLNCSMKNFF